MMRRIPVSWAVAACIIALVSCADDNPFRPTDPANLPVVEIVDAPDTIKVNVEHVYVATAADSNLAGGEVGEIVGYQWTLGDSIPPVDDLPVLRHTFAEPGVFIVRVVVTDDDGNTASDSVRVVVTMGLTPVCDAGGPYETCRGRELLLAGAAADEDGHVVLYEWDFDGDGTFDWSSSDSGTASHTYEAVGQHGVTLLATDDDGNVTADTALVTVVAGAFPQGDAGGPYKAYPGRDVVLAGSGTDADGVVVLYEWDFDGDGTYDWESGSSAEVSHTFTTEGTYAAALRVTDDCGNATVGWAEVLVTRGMLPASHPGGPYQAEPGVEIVFDGAAADSDGIVVKYEWDFDGDGTYDWESTSSGEAPHTYSDDGEFTARLRVTDDLGNTSVAEAVVRVIRYPTTWVTGPDMPLARSQAATVVIDGMMFVAGGAIHYPHAPYGWTGRAAATTRHDAFSLSTRTWSRRAAMPVGTRRAAAAAIDGRMHVVGGLGGNTHDSEYPRYDTHWIYDPATDAWAAGTPLPYPVSGATAAAIDGRMYVVTSDSMHVYDSVADEWTQLRGRPTSARDGAATAIDGKLHVIGGTTRSGAVGLLEIFDPATGKWSIEPPMPTGRWYLSAAALGGRLYAVGGSSEPRWGCFRLVEVYDPAVRTWQQAPDMVGRLSPAVGVVAGKLIVAGGFCRAEGTDQKRGYTELSTVQIFE